MKVKIKVKPEDFVVEEIANLPFVKKGDYAVYLLEKKGRNTVELLKEIAQRSKIQFKYFSYGGRKDKYGLTSQYITIKNPKIIELKEKDYSLKFIGLMGKPMAPALIKENKFKITIRDLNIEDVKKALIIMEEVNSLGFPNYFDDQRFGSFDSRQGFFAEKILKNQFNGALKIFLTSTNANERKEDRDRKQYFFDNWRDWKACKLKAKTDFEKNSFDLLSAKPNNFLEVLKLIPHEALATYFSSYQSFLWNEVLRNIILTFSKYKTFHYPGVCGEYVFYESLDEDSYRYLNGLNLPVPGNKPSLPDCIAQEAYDKVLEQNGIKNPMFNKIKLRRAFFKSFLRKAIVKPQGLEYNVVDDELYSRKKKLVLSFMLLRGSFATMFIKRIFSNK
ncbi:MAG: tRNA pseudouridine(13) synthase TruD [Candidatus Omnitrophica bacterium]|nr:tRNA pseudouridine(13) synthase TruD [Candidatus Omnitrophota bacterium]